MQGLEPKFRLPRTRDFQTSCPRTMGHTPRPGLQVLITQLEPITFAPDIEALILVGDQGVERVGLVL